MFVSPIPALTLVAVLILVLVLLVLKRRPITMTGMVIKKEICRGNYANSFVTIDQMAGFEEVELRFETYASVMCKHKRGAECFHGSGSRLDDAIPLGVVLKVKATRGDGETYDVHRLLTISPPQST